MTDTEVLQIESMMSRILDRWDQFEKEFNQNSFENSELYYIPELRDKNLTCKDVLKELRRLAMGDWYNFHQSLLSEVYIFNFAQSVNSPVLSEFMKTFTGYVEIHDTYICRKNFHSVKSDKDYFRDLMSRRIGTGAPNDLAEREISEWLKVFNLQPAELSELVLCMPDEVRATITDQNLGEIYNEAKHKIDWNGIQKFERRFSTKFEDIQKEIFNVIWRTLLMLPWEKVKNSYV